MRKLKLMLAFSGLLAMQNLFAQNAAHLNLSDAYPKAGEKIIVTYNPTGTPLDGKTGLTAAVYFLDNKDYPVADLSLTPAGKNLKGNFTVPATAKAFFVKVSKDEAVDDNNEKGYLYLVYKDKKPVEGAYTSKAYVLFTGVGSRYAKIKIDPDEAASLYHQEFQTYPQSKKEYYSMYVAMLASGKSSAFAPVYNQELKNLMKSNDEKDLILASNLLRRTKKASADSLTAVTKAKFPDGELARNELAGAFSKEKDLAKKEGLYNEFIKKYPEKANEKNQVQDYLRTELAGMYLQEGKMDDYHRWESQVKHKSNLAMGLNNVAFTWAKKGEHLDDAATASKQSLDLIKVKIANPGSQPYASAKMLKERYESSYNMYADTYAFILLKQNKPKEALTFEQPVFEKSKGNDIDINENYASILKAAGDEQKAKQVIETAIKNGKSSDYEC